MKLFGNAVLALIIISGVSAQVLSEEPRLPDTDRIVKKLMEIPEFQPYLVPGTDHVATVDQYISRASGIFIPRDDMAYGSFHTQSSNIDTIEEYYLAAFLLNRKLATAKLQKAFDEEFPRNAEGYHRMAALWYKVHAENPSYNDRAKDAVPFIIGQGQKNGFSITADSAEQFYPKAVRNRLNSAFLSELSKAGFRPDAASLEKITRSWYAYFTSPTSENFNLITTARNCVEDISKKNQGKGGLAKAYDDAVLKFAGESFYTHWSYSSRSSFYEEGIEKINDEYFKNIPVFGQ